MHRPVQNKLAIRQNTPLRPSGESPYDRNRPEINVIRGGAKTRPLPVMRNAKTIPKLKSIVINTSLKTIGLRDHGKRDLLSAMSVLQTICGKRPELVRVKKDNASWKQRRGHPIGATIVLHGNEMYRFLDTLLEVVMPRAREWKGIKATASDTFGNFMLGVPEELTRFFPEIEGNYDRYPHIPGFNVILETNTGNDKDGAALISSLGIPIIGVERLAPHLVHT